MTKQQILEQAKKVRDYLIERRGSTDLIDALTGMIMLVDIQHKGDQSELLDKFAMSAMSGICAGLADYNFNDYESQAKEAYRVAKAMLEVRQDFLMGMI